MNLLDGVRILDFSTLLPGPYATKFLGDLGAQVLRVTAPGRKDLVVEMTPIIDGRGVNDRWLNGEKQEISLNLKEEGDRRKVRELLKDTDILLEQFRPGVMEKFHLDYENLKEDFPELIYCSLTGYGADGPDAHRAGHDINYLSLSGIMSHSGRKGEGPVLYGTQIADLCAGSMNAVSGILAALYYREKTGKGLYVDVSMLDGLIPLNSLGASSALGAGKDPGREEDLLNGGSAYDFYETQDGRYFSVGALEPKFWKEFCETIGRPQWIDDGAAFSSHPERKGELREIFKEKTFSQWKAIFREKDCCVEPVLTVSEAVSTPQGKARGFVKEVDRVKQFSFPIKFKG